MLSGMRTRLASTVLRPRGARLAGGGPSTPGGFIQDGPPKGGYPAVDVSRSLPGGGMSTLAAISTIGGLFVFGMYKIVLANRQRRASAREEYDIRTSCVPFLQHETDVKNAFFNAKRVENEAEIMKDVPGWEAGASVYKSGRYMSPMIVFGIHDEQR